MLNIYNLSSWLQHYSHNCEKTRQIVWQYNPPMLNAVARWISPLKLSKGLSTLAAPQSLSVCVVGSGPAGFYTVDKVLQPGIDALDAADRQLGLALTLYRLINHRYSSATERALMLTCW